MNPAAAHNRLRLVGAETPADADWARERRARQDVVRANRAAAHRRDLDPTDPRWTLAVRASESLHGTLLTPERRSRIMRTARDLGVRPFEANLVIAIVQDQARRRAPLAAARPTLALLATPDADRHAARRARRRWILALAIAVILDVALALLLFG